MGLAMFTYEVSMPTAWDYDLSYSMYVWYHTKINTHAIAEHYKPDDGVMGIVKAIRPDPASPDKWLVDVVFTAADLPTRFEIQPLLIALEDRLLLLGFSAFHKRVSLCQSRTTNCEC